MGVNEKTDQQLVEEVRAGHRASFSELVKRHQRGLLRLSVRFMKDLDIAQDVVQEAFIKAYEKLNMFEGRASFKSWLYQITVNTARNKLRENRYDFSDIDDVQLSVAPIAERTLVHNAVSDMIQLEVDRLPFKQKTALVLRIYEDMSFAEIAAVMECPYDTAKANYRHALIKLKEVFETQSELKKWTEDVGGFFMELNTANFAEAD
ncbi:MAG: sigma-70 family RNA polymerase sigma factor [Bdellovibrio sp.]|nr:sigma-70 family RNA polymerase sigma factor [Bdellovibrio sp.]